MRDRNALTAGVPEDVPAWYEAMGLHPTLPGRLIPGRLLKPIFAPKIFHVVQLRPAYLQASLEVFRAAIWQAGARPRAVREAIAVAVSAANQCLY